METEIGAASKASAAAQKADDERKRPPKLTPRTSRTRLAAGPFKDPARLAPAVSFTDAKGLLPMPASGTILRLMAPPMVSVAPVCACRWQHAPMRLSLRPAMAGSFIPAPTAPMVNFDHQCRWGLLYCACRHGTHQRRGWAVRAGRRVSRLNG